MLNPRTQLPKAVRQKADGTAVAPLASISQVFPICLQEPGLKNKIIMKIDA